MERKTIGAFLAVLRKANGMTQQQVADRLNVSNKTVSKWERDESLPDITLIPALAEMFSVTADEILRGQRLEQTAQTEAARTEAAQEKQTKKACSQARAIISRTLARHLNWTTGAAAVLAAGMIALFTVSYGFYKPVLGFGIFMVLMTAGLVMEFLAVNTARTALTGGEIIDEDDALSAEKELLGRAKNLVSATAVMIVWALPLVLLRSGAVISWESYLYLTPGLLAISAIVWLLMDWICARIWPELRERRERTEVKLRRLYIAAGCVLAFVMIAAFGRMIDAGSTVTVKAQTITVELDDEAAYREYEKMAEDCAQGGEAWIDYCRANLTERGLPWKGSMTDYDRDYLNEYGYLVELNESTAPMIGELYQWAFYPDMGVDGREISFEMMHYYGGDSGTQFGILLFVLFAIAVLTVFVILRRRYILKAAEERRLYEQVQPDEEAGESEETDAE